MKAGLQNQGGLCLCWRLYCRPDFLWHQVQQTRKVRLDAPAMAA